MKTRCAVLALVLTLATASCARRQVIGMPNGDTDKKLSAFAFMEEGNLLTFIVDARTTRDRGNEKFIPFEIAVLNRGLKDMTLTRESFTLIDAEGNRYPCASPRELLEGYSPLDFDRRLAELDGIVANRFSANTRYPSMFSPVRVGQASPFTSTLVRDSVSVPQHSFIIDFIYFPTPKGGVMNKNFEIFLNAPELSDPVFVKLIVK